MTEETELSAHQLVCALVGDAKPESEFYDSNSIYSQTCTFTHQPDEKLDPAPKINAALSQLVAFLQGNLRGTSIEKNPSTDFVKIARRACEIIDSDKLLSKRAAEIVQIAMRAEFRMELFFARKILGESRLEAEQLAGLSYPERVALASRNFPYIFNYSTIVEEEVKVLNQFGKREHIVFCGSGPLPLTGLLLSTHVTAKLTFVEIDAEAVQLSRKLIQKWEEQDIIPAGRINVIHNDIANIVDEVMKTCDTLFVAAFIRNDVSETLFQSASKLQSKSPLLVLRSAHGLTARFAYRRSNRHMLGKYLPLVGTAVPETHAASFRQPPQVDDDDRVPMAWFPSEILNSLELYKYSK